MLRCGALLTLPSIPFMLRSAPSSHLSRASPSISLHISAEKPQDASSSPPPPSKQYPWLIVGLGNPGKKYEGTRHNIGFEMIDSLAEAEGIKLKTIQHQALTGKGEIGGSQVLLAKPMTYVNLSGQSVGPLASYYRIPVQQILVIFDDMDLEFAVMRLLPKGGHGGHNGMKNVIENLRGSREFPRLRIGIGKPPGAMDPRAFVLQSFSKQEREEMDISIARGIQGIRQSVTEGVEKTASTWNLARKSRVKLTKAEAELLANL